MDAQSRQEFIRAAVTFLQNPKLADSPLKDKISFLKDKGLSQIEVDEALNLALVNRHQNQNGRWNFLMILGLCFGGYKLYKAYQESHVIVQEKKTDPVPNITEILDKLTELKKLLELQRHNFSKDMQSLKTLLLGHEKFAAPPSIPAWQLEDDDE